MALIRRQKIAGPLGLSTWCRRRAYAIGADGTVDISPRARLFIKEKEIIGALYKGIQNLMKEENKA